MTGTPDSDDHSADQCDVPRLEPDERRDSSRVTSAIAALRADRERRGGRFTWSDVYRVLVRRKFSAEEIAALVQELPAAGLTPSDDAIPTRPGANGTTGSGTRSARAPLEARALVDICSAPLLSTEEEATLTRCYWSNARLAAAAHDPEVGAIAAGRAADARDKMTRANMRLVVHVAKWFRVPGGADLLDLVHEGTIGLMTAVERYDPTRGYKFSTYAVYWIRQAISRAIANTARLVRLPAHQEDNLRKLRRARRRLALQHGRAPSYAELAADTGLKTSEIALLDDVVRIPRSIQAARDDDGSFDVPDRRSADAANEAPARNLENEETLLQLRSALEKLTPRQQEIIRLRFGLEGTTRMTLEEVGSRLGLTRERVRQIQRRALDRLAHPGIAGWLVREDDDD